MASREGRGGIGGVSTGGIIVIVGIIIMIFWSFVLGLIVTLVGLIAFGGFARGKVLTALDLPPEGPAGHFAGSLFAVAKREKQGPDPWVLRRSDSGPIRF